MAQKFFKSIRKRHWRPVKARANRGALSSRNRISHAKSCTNCTWNALFLSAGNMPHSQHSGTGSMPLIARIGKEASALSTPHHQHDVQESATSCNPKVVCPAHSAKPGLDTWIPVKVEHPCSHLCEGSEAICASNARTQLHIPVQRNTPRF